MTNKQATIHLNVPAGLKARLVKASQRRSMKLSDYLLELIERAESMNTHAIPESLSRQYHGSGWAVAAITGGQLVDLRYVSDLAPELTDDLIEGGSIARAAVQKWIASDAAGSAVRELQALGDVSVGMCSCGEFVEL